MSLLQLKDIGKIYVSEGNVSVGIRGVNLSFDKGEFVAITGASGSGKSTLLNVISGMDTYEEGELFVENEPTSHFMQPDWEEYRKKYISFIFQEYNIIESYTVLQNVELALMHIENKRERRARAKELLNRVGLGDKLKNKGSKLSGGQKQRTVIARALAKDSPIILADEPTGNLDSATSAEIIELMKEVAKDKLLIVVTHNFEQVEEHVTRHIRVFDGAVESDTAMRPVPPLSETETPAPEKKKSKVRETLSDVKNGLTLGGAIFKATPKLSFFMCLLMLIGTLGIFFSIATMGDFTDMFKPSYMFNDIEGRVVLVKRTGGVIEESELESIKATYGAVSYIHYDSLLDKNMSYSYEYDITYEDESGREQGIIANYVFGEKITPSVGRLPEKENELLLSLPISYQPTFGSSELKITTLNINKMEYSLVGVHYYADNNLIPKVLLSEAGFKFMSVYDKSFGTDNMSYSNMYMYFNAYYTNPENGKGQETFNPNHEQIFKELITVSFDESLVPSGKIAVCDSSYLDWLSELGISESDITPTLTFSYDYNTYFYDSDSQSKRFDKNISADKLVYRASNNNGKIIFSPAALIELMEEYLSVSYTQASVFFENNSAAAAAAEKLNAEGYLAVPANTTYEPDPITMILSTLSCVVTLLLFVVITVFLAFFINLCSSRTLIAFKGDMAIMRSMGITVNVIKVGMYVRMFAALIPAFIILAVCPYLIASIPFINGMLTYLYGYQYAIIVVCMLLLTYKVTHKQVKKLFKESVKKSLKGGNAE